MARRHRARDGDLQQRHHDAEACGGPAAGAIAFMLLHNVIDRSRDPPLRAPSDREPRIERRPFSLVKGAQRCRPRRLPPGDDRTEYPDVVRGRRDDRVGNRRAITGDQHSVVRASPPGAPDESVSTQADAVIPFAPHSSHLQV